MSTSGSCLLYTSPIETAAQERTESDNEGISPERQLWDKLKANHPDALQLLRTKDGYRDVYKRQGIGNDPTLGICQTIRYGEYEVTYGHLSNVFAQFGQLSLIHI